MSCKSKSSASKSGASLKEASPLDVADVPDKLFETIHFLRELQADANVPELLRKAAGPHIEELRR